MKREFHIDGFIGGIEKLQAKLRFGFKNAECYMEDDGSVLVRYDEEEDFSLERERERLLEKNEKLKQDIKKERNIHKMMEIAKEQSEVLERIRIIERSLAPQKILKSYDKEL